MSAYNFILSELGTKRLFRRGAPTWRSSSSRGTKLGYDDKALKQTNTESISFLKKSENDEQDWLARIRAVRANASRKSHAELDESEELDRGNVVEFG